MIDLKRYSKMPRNNFLRYLYLAKSKECSIRFDTGSAWEFGSSFEIKIRNKKTDRWAVAMLSFEDIEKSKDEDLIEVCIKNMIEEVCNGRQK